MKILLPLLLLMSFATAQPAAAKLSLSRSYGGAVLTGRVYVPRPDVLTGAWSGVGFARLMRCAPLCRVVPSIPLKGTTVIGGGSTYRIALGGQFITGQKIRVTLRFRGAGTLVTEGVVGR